MYEIIWLSLSVDILLSSLFIECYSFLTVNFTKTNYKYDIYYVNVNNERIRLSTLIYFYE